MDELLAALDKQSKKEILKYISSLRDELDIPVIYVSHASDEVAQLADHLILMENGRVKATGEMSELLTRLDLSLAHNDDAEDLIEAIVVEHDETYNLTYLEFPGGRFSVAHKDLTIGHNVRLRVAARDVSLTLEPQSGTSILNVFHVKVDEISPTGSSQVTVRLLAEGVPMLSRITRKSADLLKLKVGKSLYAQVKSVALLS